jgi:hypothetical protein
VNISFGSFAKALGFQAPVSAASVGKSLNFSYPISLYTVVTDTAAPVAPVLSPEDQGQFQWTDPSAEFDSPPPKTAIRKATSFAFSLWAPDAEVFPANFSLPAGGPGSGIEFFDNGQGMWAYNYPGHIAHGISYWQVTSINSYGSTPSAKAQFGTNAPEISFSVDGDQMHATVTGVGFISAQCNVVVSCFDYPTKTYTGDITKGVRVAIQCQNDGQYWNVQVTSVEGGPTISGKIPCSGGGLA